MPPRRKNPKQSFKQRAIELGWVGAQIGGLAFFAWLNASHFDATELKMLGEFAVYYKLLKTLEGYT